MNKQRIYYPKTTYSQRRLLFQVWEETQNVSEACRQARTSLSTFYYWKERYERGGYEALAEMEKPGPEKGIQVAAEIQEKVVGLKKSHPDWGKRRIADEMAKGNSWVPLISPNAVRRILVENELWPEAADEEKKSLPPHKPHRARARTKPECGPVLRPGRA
jgi:transposase